MKKILSILIFISASSVIAQDLYVDNSSYVYVRDIPLFVNDDIRLETTTSNIFLRGDAQLLQNTDSKNSDIGELSVFQAQTKGVYEYNYWCSPVGVGVNSATQANVAFNGANNVHDPANEFDVTNITSAAYPFTNALEATTTQISSRWLYSLQEAEGYNAWILQGETGSVNPGYGFTLKGYPQPPPPTTILNTLDFRGRPNNGTMSIALNFDGVDDEPDSEPINQVSTLTGNPYPSAMDLKMFFADPSSSNEVVTDGNIYFWEQVDIGSHFIEDYEGGYAIYTPGALGNLADNGSYAVATFIDYESDGGSGSATGGVSDDFTPNFSRRYAAIGQGFLINSGGTGLGNAEINNNMRLYLPQDSDPLGSGSVFRNAENDDAPIIAMSHNGVDYMEIINNPLIIPEIRIHTHIDDIYYRENVIAFRENTDLTYNKFCDADMGSALASDAFMSADDVNVVIKSVAYNADVRIPFNLKAEHDNTSFEIAIRTLHHIPEDVSIYLYDAVTNVYTDIINNDYIISLNEGLHANRFEITFSQEETLSNAVFNIDNFRVFQNNGASQLTILNPNNLDITGVSLIDVTGKQILNDVTTSNKARLTYSTANLSEGVYIVKATISNSKTITEKVIIKQ